ncbi:MAG: trypsin-like peptidase domain-containing protein [Oscillospiraceae bacterium]|nr:trypsin-like peptidase domain-containing protein [Oscillospiraceae bacterium]
MYNLNEKPGPQPGHDGWYASGPVHSSVENNKPGPQPNSDGWYASGPVREQGQSSGESAPRTYSYRSTPQAALPGRPVQRQLPPPPTVFPPTQGSRKEPKPKRTLGRGLVAALLAVSLLGGVAGGGAVTWLLNNQEEPPVAQVQQNTFIPTIAQPDTRTNEPAAVPAMDVTYAVDRAAASVVEISLSTQVQTFFWGSRESQSAGSGVILSPDGYIVTNHHVIENAIEIYVRTYDGREFPATLIGSDPQTDLAVIKIDAQGLRPARFADSDAVRVGQTSVAIGNPLGTLGGTVTQGIVSALDRQITIDGQEMTLMQTSAAVNPGNSGGGLFNASGELIGVVNAKSGGMDIEGLGFAIPSNIVTKIVDDLMNHGYITGRPELGIQVVQIDDLDAAEYHGVNGLGIFVINVTRENGLAPGDQILSIDGVEIEEIFQVSDAVQSAGVGGRMRITVIRNGETIIVNAIVGERAPELVSS